jgi:hypothetical protein
LPAGRGEQRGEPHCGPAGREAMNEIAGDTRGHGVFKRPETAIYRCPARSVLNIIINLAR